MRNRQIFKILTCLVLMVVMVKYSSIVEVAMSNIGNRFNVKELNIWDWYHNNTVYCGGNYTLYGHRFFKLKYAFFDVSDNDHFSIECRHKHLPSKEWFFGNYAPAYHTRNLRSVDLTKAKNAEFRDNLVIVVNREYPHNFYHAMTQWYNIFALSVFFKFDFRKVDILFLDNSPAVHLDAQWAYLFGNVTKAKYLKKPVIFREAIFSIPGHESPMYYMDQDKMQYVEEFSAKYLETFGLNSNKILDCSNLSIVMGVRHDYYWHPGILRNTERKYQNENEILDILRNEFKGHTIRTLIAEDMSLNEQLALTTKADILIGMHGCIMTHAMFMPRHGALFEMYPKYWKPKHFFSAIAKWRGLKYTYWRNEFKWNEFIDHYTRIPPEVIRNYSRDIKMQLCGKVNTKTATPLTHIN